MRRIFAVGFAVLLLACGCGKRTSSTGGRGIVEGPEGGIVSRDAIAFLEDALAKYRFTDLGYERRDNDLVVAYAPSGNETDGELLERNLKILTLVGAAVQGIDDVHVVVRSEGFHIRLSARLEDLHAVVQGALDPERLADRVDVGFDPAFFEGRAPDGRPVADALESLRLPDLGVDVRHRNVVVRWEQGAEAPGRLLVDLVRVACRAAPAAGDAHELVLVPRVGGSQVVVMRVRVSDVRGYLDGSLDPAAFNDRILFNLF